jgi:hypothetical protein
MAFSTVSVQMSVRPATPMCGVHCLLHNILTLLLVMSCRNDAAWENSYVNTAFWAGSRLNTASKRRYIPPLPSVKNRSTSSKLHQRPQNFITITI